MNFQKAKSLLATLLFLAVLGALAYYVSRPANGHQPAAQLEGREDGKQNVKPTVRADNAVVHMDIGFASEQKLAQHYRKHGGEFGHISIDEYLHIAQALRDTHAGGDILEHIRRDGIVSRFDRRTGTFVAFNADNTIRTCFKPNDGERYFHRQKNKDH